MELMGVSPRRVAARLVAGIDGTLLTLSLMLVTLGLATLFSASYDQPGRVSAQAANLLVALAAMWLVAQIPPQTLMRFAVPAYFLGLALLVAVALAGDVVNGARRWLHVGVARFQPAEVMKLALPMSLRQISRRMSGVTVHVKRASFSTCWSVVARSDSDVADDPDRALNGSPSTISSRPVCTTTPGSATWAAG